MDDRVVQLLEEFLERMSGSSGAADNLTTSLKSLLGSTSKLKTAQDVESEVVKLLTTNKRNLSIGIKNLGGITQRAVLGLTTLEAGLYQTKGAFTTLTPVVNTFAETTKGTIEALGEMASGISFVGFSLGNIPKGLAKAVSLFVDAVAKSVTFQLETAQKMADQFMDVSKAGATFGGSIDRMRLAANEAGLDVTTYTKIIKSNSEALVRMGAGQEQGAIAIGKTARNIVNFDRKLFALYGNFDNLTETIADYASLQSRLGINAVANQTELERGAKAYLLQQRELSVLTGKRNEDLKKEAEARRQVTAWQMALRKMTPEMKLAAESMASVAKTVGGEEYEKYVMEFVATQGGTLSGMSDMAYQLEAGASELTGIIPHLYANLNMGIKDFNRLMADTFEANKHNIDSFTKSTAANQYANLAFTKRGVEYTDLIAKFAGAAITGSDNLDKMIINLRKFDQQQQEGIGRATDSLLTAEEKRMQLQMKIDEQVAKNMDRMPRLVEFLYAQTETLLDLTGKYNELIGLATDAMLGVPGAADKLKDALVILAKQIVGWEDRPTRETAESLRRRQEKQAEAAKLSEQQAMELYKNKDQAEAFNVEMAKAAQAGNEKVWISRFRRYAEVRERQSKQSDGQSLRERLGSDVEQKALGGIVTKPSIAGEAGPEAVVPLPDGRTIPTNIDLSPLLNALAQNATLTEEMLLELKDMKDIQEKILTYSM